MRSSPYIEIMEPSVGSAVLGSQREVVTSARALRAWAACWALWGAILCAFLFFWSTWPYANLDEPPGPAWISLVGLVLLLPSLPWAVAPVVLLILGLAWLRRAAPGRWRWLAAWSGAVAAGIMLEALLVTRFGVPWEAPTYLGPAVLAWVFVPEIAGFLILGAVMARVVAVATRSPASRIAG